MERWKEKSSSCSLISSVNSASTSVNSVEVVGGRDLKDAKREKLFKKVNNIKGN